MKRYDYYSLCAIVVAAPHLTKSGSTAVFCVFAFIALWKAFSGCSPP